MKNGKNKFKMLTVIITVFMMICMLAACGDSKQSVKGETFDGGNIEVFVPEGWKAYHGPDVFDSYEEGYDPNVVNVGKGVEDEVELFSKPMVNINYSGDKSLIMPSKDIYEDGKDIEDITTGDYTWKGFTGVSIGYPIAVLFTEFDGQQIQVSMTLENGDQKISLEDPDVLALLEGIKVK